MRNLLLTWALISFIPFFAARSSNAAPECVRVYYDSPSGRHHPYGRLYSIGLQNLLGHFPQFQQIVEPISNYEKGQTEQCQATIYIGTDYYSEIPEAFLEDFATTNHQVAWIGYSAWKLGQERLQDALGVKYKGLTKLDTVNTDHLGRPSFYRFFEYKGETWEKYGEFNPDHGGRFNSEYEMAILEVTSQSTKVLSQGVHNFTREKLPHIIRKYNRFYVADQPFSYMYEASPYSIFADVLFDILEVQPKYPDKKPAVFRIEDISSKMPAEKVARMANIFHTEDIPFHVALVPIFADPFGHTGLDRTGNGLPIQDDPKFIETLENLRSKGATFIWHGVTHQYDRNRNPARGITGEDYEFWDVPNDCPVADDSVEWVLGRLDRGWSVLSQAGIFPKIWEVPHYQASSLDYVIFSKVFSWHIGRIAYAPFAVKGEPAIPPSALWYETSGLQGSQTRRDALLNLEVQVDGDSFGQLFPYEIYGDIYGQRVLPENLGYPQGRVPRSHMGPKTIDEMIASAKRNRVLRDVWGSLFMHPYVLGGYGHSDEPDMMTAELKVRELIRKMRDFGYEFINLNDFIRDRKDILRPEPIVRGRKIP